MNEVNPRRARLVLRWVTENMEVAGIKSMTWTIRVQYRTYRFAV